MCSGSYVRALAGVMSIGTTELYGVGDDIDGYADKTLGNVKMPDPPTIDKVTPAPPSIGDTVTKPALSQGAPVGQKRSQRSAARLGTSQFVIPPKQGIYTPR